MNERATTTVPFEAPSAGSWELDQAHFSPNCSRIVRDAIEHGMKAGMDDGFAMVGAPVKTMEACFLNGRFYRRLVPLVGANKNMPEPPPFVLKIATRVHPGFRSRTKTAAAALEGRIWMDELTRWEDEWKPQLIATSRRIGAIELAPLSDAELAALVDEANAHVRNGLALHFRLHVSDLGPIGVLLVKGRDLGLDSLSLMQCLSGYSLATSAPAIAMANIAKHLDDDQMAEIETVDDIRAGGPEASAALDAFLDEYGDRLTGGYDVIDLTLAEMPGAILGGIRSAKSRPVDDSARELGDAMAAELRATIPESERANFDRYVADARALYGLRDENGPITYEWPAGILRRILLHAADRLVASGALDDPRHVFDLSAAELIAALRAGPDGAGSTVSASEAKRRFDARQEWVGLEAPLLLGPEPVIPPLEVLPGPLAELMDIIVTVLDLIDSPVERSGLNGVGVGEGDYVGRARVVSDVIDALADFEPGDVLVAPFTVPTINAVLAMAGAVITEEGGLLSHAAVIAREFGIPGVIGIDEATTSIPDGAMVKVDAANGIVSLV